MRLSSARESDNGPDLERLVAVRSPSRNLGNGATHSYAASDIDAKSPRGTWYPRPMPHALLVVALAGLAACSSKKGGDAVASRDIATVNALVPAPLKDKLVFEERKIKDGPYVYIVAAPKDWEGFMTSVGPTDATATSFRVVYKCASEPCKAMDWNTDIDKVYEEAPLQKEKVEKDEKRKNGRTILADDDAAKRVLVAKWADGADNYLWCEAYLEKPWSDARAAFEKACELITVTDSGGFNLL